MTDLPLQSNPNLEQFEIVKAGISSFPSLSLSSPGAGNYSGNEAITTVAHNLGYTPPFIAFLQITTASPVKTYTIPFTFMAGSSATASWEYYQAYVDNTNLYLLTDILVYAVAKSGGGATFVCKYYLLRDRARN